MGQFYLYRHLRKDTGIPIYIGIGTKYSNPSTLTQEYQRAFNKKSRNTYLKRIINKIGVDVEILYESESREEIKLKEQEFITLYGRQDLGLGTLINLTDGGDGILGKHHSNETKEKIGQRHKGNKYWVGKRHSDETKKKISARNKGNKYCLGYKHTAETKKNMGLAQKGNTKWLGKKHSEESKIKIGNSSKGRTHTSPLKGKSLPPEWCAKLKASRGTRAPNKGKKHSQETKNKISASLKKHRKI